jgi:hypothetical protein
MVRTFRIPQRRKIDRPPGLAITELQQFPDGEDIDGPRNAGLLAINHPMRLLPREYFSEFSRPESLKLSDVLFSSKYIRPQIVTCLYRNRSVVNLMLFYKDTAKCDISKGFPACF